MSTTISVTKILPTSILVVLEYGLGLESRLRSIFAGLGLGKICNQVRFQFSLHICSVLFRPYDILPTRIVYNALLT